MTDTPSSATRKNTRYSQGGKTSVSKKAVGWWERDVSICTPADDDIIIIALPLLYDGRPDLLSYDLYQSNNLDWIILQANSIVDITEEFVAGARIRAPSPRRVKGAILMKPINYSES